MENRYLVPLDGSELAEHAIPWAQAFAEAFEARVELFRCCEPLASVYMLPEFAAPAPVYFDQTAMHKQIDEYLDSVAGTLPKGLTIKTRCEGDATTAILERAESDEVDTVVVASHGRGGIGRWLLGSVTTKVVRGARKPVLVITSSTEECQAPDIKRVLLPLDGSPTSEAAIPKAVEIAKRFRAELVLYRGVNHSLLGDPKVDSAVKLEIGRAQDYLDNVREKYADVTTVTVVDIARPSEGILKQAEECDLIVMSSHGRSGVQRWLLGSVAEKVIQSAKEPVLVVYKRD